MGILRDIKTTANIFGAVRKAWKSEASAVQLKQIYTMPRVTFKPAYLNTIEGCQTWKLGQDTDRAVKEVFANLPYEVQRRLEFAPKQSGEWVERARFWQRKLCPVLPRRMYHRVMTLFIGWYAHCLRNRHIVEAEE